MQGMLKENKDFFPGKATCRRHRTSAKKYSRNLCCTILQGHLLLSCHRPDQTRKQVFGFYVEHVIFPFRIILIFFRKEVSLIFFCVVSWAEPTHQRTYKVPDEQAMESSPAVLFAAEPRPAGLSAPAVLFQIPRHTPLQQRERAGQEEGPSVQALWRKEKIQKKIPITLNKAAKKLRLFFTSWWDFEFKKWWLSEGYEGSESGSVFIEFGSPSLIYMDKEAVPIIPISCSIHQMISWSTRNFAINGESGGVGGDTAESKLIVVNDIVVQLKKLAQRFNFTTQSKSQRCHWQCRLKKYISKTLRCCRHHLIKIHQWTTVTF